MDWSDRVGRRLKLRDLHILLAISEHGNMAKAAESLAISRPVVSKTIAQMEHTLGVRLLDRSPQGLEPTLFGHSLIRRSLIIFDELKQSVKELEFLADPKAGELRIGCTEPIAGGILPVIIDRLSLQIPGLVLQEADLITLQLHALRERKVELVLSQLLSSPTEPDMNVEILYHERRFVVAGKRNKWAARRKIALAELVDGPWILAPTELAPGSPVVEAFRANGLDVPRATVLGYSLPLRSSLLATGRFITMVPSSVLRFGAERSSLKVLSVNLPDLRQPVAIVTLKNRTLSPVAMRFIECARSAAKPLTNAKPRH
jgi:DNA-binding transcriptional LysR family regulator